ncbi:hypothetical protein BDC45DRAFT_539748 [Circinella umbellata]|nr:hypothetical protein BDC45DRAFT_539748 [Circinella umbellata]
MILNSFHQILLEARRSSTKQYCGFTLCANIEGNKGSDPRDGRKGFNLEKRSEYVWIQSTHALEMLVISGYYDKLGSRRKAGLTGSSLPAIIAKELYRERNNGFAVTIPVQPVQNHNSQYTSDGDLASLMFKIACIKIYSKNDEQKILSTLLDNKDLTSIKQRDLGCVRARSKEHYHLPLWELFFDGTTT